MNSSDFFINFAVISAAKSMGDPADGKVVELLLDSKAAHVRNIGG